MSRKIQAIIAGELMETITREGKEYKGKPQTEHIAVVYCPGGQLVNVNNCDFEGKKGRGDEVAINCDIYAGKDDFFVRSTELHPVS